VRPGVPLLPATPAPSRTPAAPPARPWPWSSPVAEHSSRWSVAPRTPQTYRTRLQSRACPGLAGERSIHYKPHSRRDSKRPLILASKNNKWQNVVCWIFTASTDRNTEARLYIKWHALCICYASFCGCDIISSIIPHPNCQRWKRRAINRWIERLKNTIVTFGLIKVGNRVDFFSFAK